MFKSMIIDEQRVFSLVKYSGRTGNKNVKESDHNTLILELNINWKTDIEETSERIEIYNFKHEEHFQSFINNSDENEVLNALFIDENEDLEKSSLKWLNTVNKIISSSFPKIRIKRGKLNPDLEDLFNKKECLKAKIAIAEKNYEDDYEQLSEQLEDITEQISQLCSEKNKQIVEDYIGDFDSGLEGFNQIKTWALKKKLAPKNVIDPPAAKKDASGNLITDRNSIENL